MRSQHSLVTTVHNSPQLPQAVSFRTPHNSYHDNFTTKLRQQRSGGSKFDSQSWKHKTIPKLVAVWCKRLTRPRSRYILKKRMVSRSTADRDATSTAGSSTKGASTTAINSTGRQVSHGDGPRQRNFDVCQEALAQAKDGHSRSDNNNSMDSYNSSTSSEGERSRRHTPEEFIARRKQAVVDKIMARFQKWLDKRLDIISYSIETSVAAEDGGEGGGNTNRCHRRGSDGKESGQSSRRPKRQLQDDEAEDISGGGDDNEPNRGGNKRAKKDAEDSVRWACPFRKHNPKIHNKQSCCSSWTSFHRLKEHLYRVHLLPKYSCPRCTNAFNDAKELNAHQRADVPCKKSDLMPMEGIDKATEDELRRRKKHGSTQSEKERWGDIYMLLFPNTDKNSIPSPYADHFETVTSARKLARYKHMEKRIKTELPQLVRQQVESQFETVEDDLLRNLPDLVRGLISNLYRSSPGDDGSPVGTRATSRSTTPDPVLTEETGTIVGNEDVDWDLGAILEDGSITEWDFDFDIYGGQYPIDGSFGADKASGSDSGYASTGTVAGLHGR